MMSMSYLSNAIEELLLENKMSAAGLARASKITEAQISRWRSATQQWIASKDLIALAAGFNHRPETHARLLYARLQDDLVGPGSRFIGLKLERIPTPAPQSTFPILPPRDYAHLLTIANHITTDSSVRTMVESIAKMCQRESLSPQPGQI